MKHDLEDAIGFKPSRRSFLSLAAGLGAATVAGFGGASSAHAANAGSPAEFTAAFQSIILHENEHVAFLCQSLGSNARPKPTFIGLKQPNLQSFLKTASAFENTGAGAYLNAAPWIKDPKYLEAAASIAIVEARHAGFLDVATSQPITVENLSFETANSPGYVAKQVGPFIQSLNGGPPLTYAYAASAANDIAILNFALALEYLEAEFYNINVPIYY